MLNKKEVVITPNFFIPLKKAEREAFTQTAEAYGKFLELSVVIRYE
jgi:hypothetical protein